MKKVFSMVAICCLAMMSFVFTGCETDVKKDIVISCTTSFGWSSSSSTAVTGNVSANQIKAIYTEELQKIGETMGDYVVLRKQTDNDKVFKTVNAAAETAKNRAISELDALNELDSRYTSFAVIVSYTNIGDKTIKITHTYREETKE